MPPTPHARKIKEKKSHFFSFTPTAGTWKASYPHLLLHFLTSFTPLHNLFKSHSHKTHSLDSKLGLKVGFLDFLVTRIDMTDWSLWFFSLIWYYLMFYDWFRLSKHGNSWSGWRSWVKSQEKGWIRWLRFRNTTASIL